MSLVTPKSHHLDRRAAQIAAEGQGDPDDLLDTNTVSIWLGVSRQWLEIGRVKSYGPKYIRIGPRRTRYRRSDVLSWLDERTHQCTAEYTKKPAER